MQERNQQVKEAGWETEEKEERHASKDHACKDRGRPSDDA